MSKSNGNSEPAHDYLIIGAGPAGLELGYFLGRAGRSYLILEAGDGPGTFFKEFPRHRQLISINKVHTGYEDPEVNLRWDWNSLLGADDARLFKDFSEDYFPAADFMVDYLEDYAGHHELAVQYGTRVAQVEKEGELFRITDAEGNRYAAPRLIVATGLSRPYQPPIPGIELTENYVDVSVDPEDFVGEQVLVLGKGNSGFETADNLISTASVIHIASPNPVRFAWQTHYVGHLRAVNNNFLDTYQLKSQNAVLDCTIKSIERRDGRYVVSVAYSHADGEAEDLHYDRVICCTGFRFDDSIFAATCRPQLALDDRFPDLTTSWESVNVPALYFAGAIMQMRDFKKYTTGFIHGFRYNIRSLHRFLEQRYHAVEWPGRQIELDPQSLTDAVIARVNKASGLWQQFNVLCDTIELAGDRSMACYYEEMPVEYVHEHDDGGEFFLINLEFGASRQDPFKIERRPDPAHASESFFLHPAIRHYRGGHLVGEHHVLEDLCAEWRNEEMHVRPLYEFFSRALSGGTETAAPTASAERV